MLRIGWRRPLWIQTLYFVLLLNLTISIVPTLLAQESKLSNKDSKTLKETFRYIESLEPSRLKISKQTYSRYSNFESFFHFHYSGKKLSRWIQSRIKNYSKGSTGDFIAYFHEGEVVLGKSFFQLPKLDRALILLHEARHADGKEYSHVPCPDNFRFLNARDLNIVPSGKKGCDSTLDGGYGLTASFLFELGSYGFLSQSETAHRYNSEISRILASSD
ncbi:hypothetical protein LPTSP3_g35600 [Leptospira kobayashii]|uniref:Uncharacterized protein n=1 Tax=Leptospira kobayashii TaxID=1917830 RepID=A0ABN6KHB5_9LEPT|nr:hypothetical protein LPTSP3_g35600 [Leptospira kobayashii]